MQYASIVLGLGYIVLGLGYVVFAVHRGAQGSWGRACMYGFIAVVWWVGAFFWYKAAMTRRRAKKLEQEKWKVKSRLPARWELEEMLKDYDMSTEKGD